MPPNVPQLAGHSDITLSKGEEHILAMFSTDGAGFALQKSEWDIEEEFLALVDIARTADREGDRLAAMRQINSRLREVAELNGLVVKGSMHVRGTTPDGRRIDAVQSSSRLLTTIKKGRPHGQGGTSPFSDRIHEPLDARSDGSGKGGS